MEGRKSLYILGFLSSFLFLLLANKAGAESNILINQVQTSGGTGATHQDFIELYNQADQSFDLKGCKLVKRTASGSSDTNIKSWSSSIIIPSQGYYLWSNSNYTTISATPDITTSETISDNNSVALRCGSSEPLTIMDALTWGQVTNALGEGESITNPEPNQVLQRKKLTNNYRQDTDDNKNDFTISSPNPHNSTFVENNNPIVTEIKEITNTIYIPTPAATINVGEVVINELVSDPTTDETEWIELYNKSNKIINLSDFTLEDASGSNMQLSGTLGNDQFSRWIIIKNLKFTLNNDSESVLLKFQGQIIDQVTYNKTATGDSALAANKPHSLSRIPDGQDTDQSNSDFKISPATPNQSNQQLGSIQTDEETSNSSLVINELFPNPLFSDENQEFIELLNKSPNKIDLNNWLIKDNLSTYQINNKDFTNTIIEPDKYFVLPRTVTNLVLDNDTKENIEIISSDKKIIVKISYPTPAPENQSYARDNNGKYFWSLSITPDKANNIDLPNLPPKISINIPDEGKTNELLIFDASDSADPELSQLNYFWEFGDGSTSNLAAPSHAYGKEKTYTVSVTATDVNGQKSQKSAKLKIINNNESVTPIKNIEIKPTKIANKKPNEPNDSQLITGLVTIPPGMISKNTFYIDSLDYPIQITKPLDFIKSGQQISLTGQTKNYTNGPKFFVSKNDIVSNLGVGEPIESLETNISDLNIEQNNTLIKISGQIDKLNSKSLTIKDGEDLLKIYTTNTLDKNNLVKGQKIQAVGFLKYDNETPKLYITDKGSITTEKILPTKNQEKIEIPTTETNYNFVYLLLILASATIITTLFWQKISKLKIITKIRGLF